MRTSINPLKTLYFNDAVHTDTNIMLVINIPTYECEKRIEEAYMENVNPKTNEIFSELNICVIN